MKTYLIQFKIGDIAGKLSTCTTDDYEALRESTTKVRYILEDALIENIVIDDSIIELSDSIAPDIIVAVNNTYKI